MRKTITITAFLFVLLCLPIAGMATDEPVKAQVDRTELPIKGPWYPPITTLDARDAKAPPMFEVKAPKDAPNVVVILLDDLGFGGTSATGGVIANAALRQARQPGPAVQPVPHHGAVLADSASADDRPQSPLVPTRPRSPRWRPPSPAPPACCPTTSPPSPRCCGSTATARPRSASTMKRRSGKSVPRAHSPLAEPSWVSTSSTASWAVKPINGHRPSITT